MKIFCISIYNQNHSFFIENNLTPVGLGNNQFDNNWINDKFENDISEKNENYGEYSFHYRLWKDSSLLKSQEHSWIGFCTYRRFWIKKNLYPPTNMKELSLSILKEVPKEWNVQEAYIIDPKGKKILDYHVNNFDLDIILNEYYIRTTGSSNKIELINNT